VWREFGGLLEELVGRPIPVRHGEWRAGEQRVYVSDLRKAERDLGWRPRVSPREGIARLFAWVQANRGLLPE